MDENSKVELNNVEARRINDWFRDCQRQAIEVPIGDANLWITDSYFEQVQNSQRVAGTPDTTVFRGSNVVSGAGNLTVSGTRFEDALSAIQWSGDANIETSRFEYTGWINAYGPGTMNIVNSAFKGRANPTGDSDSVRASNGAIVNISASSMSLLYSSCPAACKSGFGAIVATSGGAINLKESALGVGLPLYPNVILRTASGTISADANTWIQPVSSQSADDLKTITAQTLLLTDPPGLPQISDGTSAVLLFPQAITPLLGTVATPGVLIDAIADANPGQTNELKSPIDGSTITVDALGNPRVDANGKRNIGAVQLTLSPHLVVTTVGTSSVELSWSRPADPASGAITGYLVQYKVSTSGTWVDLPLIVDPATVTTTVMSLTPGTAYDFQVLAVNPAQGPPSNMVSATPVDVPDAPVVSATPGNGQVDLSWPTPASNGSPITSYIVLFRQVGIPAWTTYQSYLGSATSAKVFGLFNGVNYEFAVVATNGVGTGPMGTTTATPTGPVIPPLSANPGDRQVSLSWLPTTTGGVVSYRVRYRVGNQVPWTTLPSQPTTQTTAVVTGLTNGVTYGFQVEALGSGGEVLAATNIVSAIPSQVPQAPTVTTEVVTAIDKTTATGHGSITDLGSSNPTQHGVCWNTTGTPTTADSKTEDGPVSATGAFTSSMTGLSPGTTYYVRAYSTNASGTSYGNQVSFNSLGTLPSGTPASYGVTVTRIEMWKSNGKPNDWVTIFSGTAQLDVKTGGGFPGACDLKLPAGTYTQIKVTFNNAFPVTGTLSYNGTAYYTTATTFGGQTNLASTPTTVAGSMAEYTFYNPAWGVLNADVTDTSSITPITVGPTTNYQPTLRFTINNTLHLKGTAGDPSSYYFSLDAPTVSLIEP